MVHYIGGMVSLFSFPAYFCGVLFLISLSERPCLIDATKEVGGGASGTA